ncbi:hypothetical protein [Deinococcus marmoris]|uniref:Uncharacterized protein n=1 Tax=Deinococcus marmoris TaxID=249408 RepID=A0A1U7P2Z4_9DEIO|nr:hypothetical protein [Deinococcus marmoris]OLV19528.1 hypothetical protein BOO71_0002323 [Deinococcus marmoris]
MTEDGQRHTGKGDYALGRVLWIGCHGEVPPGTQHMHPPLLLTQPRRRRARSAPGGIKVPYIKAWPVRQIEPLTGGWVPRDTTNEGLSSPFGPTGVGPRGNWIRTGSNTLRYLQVGNLYESGPRKNWTDRTPGFHSGVAYIDLLRVEVREARIEIGPEDLYPDKQIAQSGWLFRATPEPSAAEHNTLLDDGKYGEPAYYDRPLAPGIPAKEPAMAYAVEMLADRWRVHMRLLLQGMSWDGDAGDGYNANIGFSDITANLKLQSFAATVDIGLDGQIIGQAVGPRTILASATITDLAPQVDAGYAAAVNSRMSELNTWLDSMETPEPDLSTVVPGSTQDQVQLTGPAVQIGKGVWRQPVTDTQPLILAGVKGAAKPTVGGLKMLSYDAGAVWLSADPNIFGNPDHQGPAVLSVSNPGYALTQRLGIRPRLAAPVSSFLATRVRALQEFQPSEATVTDLNGQTAPTPADASTPWYDAGGSLGDGLLTVKFTGLPEDGWDLWALLVREIKTPVSTTYQSDRTRINNPLAADVENPDGAAVWHLREDAGPDELTITVIPAARRAITGITLVYASLATDMTPALDWPF